MLALRSLLIVILLLGSLGLSGICAEAASCSESAAMSGSDCHDPATVMDRGCCCSDTISTDRAVLAASRHALSDAALGSNCSVAALPAQRGAQSTTAQDLSPPSGRARHLLLGVQQN